MMIYDSMDLSKLIVHVQQVEDSRIRGESVRSRGLTVLTRQVPARVVTGALFEIVISQDV